MLSAGHAVHSYELGVLLLKRRMGVGLQPTVSSTLGGGTYPREHVTSFTNWR